MITCKRLVSLVLVLGAAALGGAAPPPAQARPWTLILAPKPPSYPGYQDRQQVIDQARHISDRLENYIKAWMDGHASAHIPDEFIPAGNDFRVLKNFTLVRPEDVRPEQQWITRPARPIDLNATLGQFPDPHCTYLLLPMLAPFGSRVLMEGEFPHARFFSIQPTPSFEPELYKNGAGGVPEVPLVDADIEPLPGCTNPFRVGADRDAVRRSFRATFDLRIGDPVALNHGAFTPPYYRAPGNTRTAGAIFYQGAGVKEKDWRKRFDLGNIWVRYYAPDRRDTPWGGVPQPRVWYELPDGRRYFIKIDFSELVRRFNVTKPAPASAPVSTKPEEANAGWFKQWGILRSIYGGIATRTGWLDKQWVREYDLGMNGRGEEVAAPGNYEPSATTCTHINYFSRSIALDKNQVAVISGRLPTFPDTRPGLERMTGAQMRYWSLCGYDESFPDRDGFVGAVSASLMDDELVLNAQRRYVIVLSRPDDRPANADTRRGVTWTDWGPTGRLAFTLRWMSIAPEWTFPLAPNEKNLGRETDWASKRFNPSVISLNNRSGFLGEYQPIVTLMSKGDFERLGADVSVRLP